MEGLKTIGKQAKHIAESVLRSYGQVFFSDSYFFSVLLLLVTFFDLYAGLAGLISIVTANIVALGMGFERQRIHQGLLGFNALLAGLGLGIYFAPGPQLLLIVVLSSVFSLFMSVALQGVIGKYALPYMSVPFLLTVWIFTLATRNFEALGISERGIFTMNELYSLGGNKLVHLYEWWNSIPVGNAVRVYLISLGAVFFQYNILSGLIIALGLLIYSRIAFSLSILGFASAYLFYQVTGASMSEFSYSYVGFNYILTAIAVGGFFIIPGWKSYFWVVVLIPLVAVVTISLNKAFSLLQLSVFSLPFNLLVLLFIYVLKFRFNPSAGLAEVIIQQNSPEKNVYSWINNRNRFRFPGLKEMVLPFFGEWTVSQAKDGAFTHQGPWRFAWDFVIMDEDEKQYRNEGDRLEDYYSYNAPVLAPADGVVAEVSNGVPDNLPGEVNTIENWGNTVIIKHGENLYSKLSHLRENSVKVHKGEAVKCGQTIGHCGNSGRSPYPHLHFQLQSQPYIGAMTLEYPLSNYISREGERFSLHTTGEPLNAEKVRNIEQDPLLLKSFDLVPGKRFTLISDPLLNLSEELCEVKTTVYNQSYIWCESTQSAAWFTSTSRMLYFTHFSGNKKSLLYHYFLSFYTLQKGFYPSLTIQDEVAINLMFRGPLLWIQDFLIPFFRFLKAEYSVVYEYTDSRINPGRILLHAQIRQTIFSLRFRQIDYRIELRERGVESIEFTSQNRQSKLLCVESSLY